MIKELLIEQEKKEIRKLLYQLSNAFTLLSQDFFKVENLISVRYLLRKNSFTSYCKIIQSSPEGMNRCTECDRRLIDTVLKSNKPVYHICHAGLVDFCFPIRNKKDIIPVIGGQILLHILTPEEEKEILMKTTSLNLDVERLRDSLRKVPVIPVRAIKTLIALLSSLFEQFSVLEVTEILNKFSGIKSPQGKKLYSIVSFLKQNFKEDYSLNDIADKLSISPYYMEHLFKKKFGTSVIAYRNYLRLLAAKELLKNSQISITQIAFNLGWNDSNYFSNYFKKETGVSPSSYRKYFKKNNIL